MPTDLVTIKVTTGTRTMLRLLAANASKDMYEVAESLAWDEMKRKKIVPSKVLKSFEQRKAKLWTHKN